MFVVEVPFKSNGKSARFFDDHIEFNKLCIRYDDIEVLTATASSMTYSLAFIPVGRAFTGAVSFKMNYGKRHHINMNAGSIFGIPFMRNPRKNEMLFPPLFDAVYSVIAKAMAQRYIAAIQRGATIEIAGLSINNSCATSKSKKATPLHKGNYRESQVITGAGVFVYDKQGNTLWQSPAFKYKNILLVPHILDAIFGA
jgi:hypothetical protein